MNGLGSSPFLARIKLLLPACLPARTKGCAWVLGFLAGLACLVVWLFGRVWNLASYHLTLLLYYHLGGCFCYEWVYLFRLVVWIELRLMDVLRVLSIFCTPEHTYKLVKQTIRSCSTTSRQTFRCVLQCVPNCQVVYLYIAELPCIRAVMQQYSSAFRHGYIVRRCTICNRAKDRWYSWHCKVGSAGRPAGRQTGLLAKKWAMIHWYVRSGYTL